MSPTLDAARIVPVRGAELSTHTNRHHKTMKRHAETSTGHRFAIVKPHATNSICEFVEAEDLPDDLVERMDSSPQEYFLFADYYGDVHLANDAERWTMPIGSEVDGINKPSAPDRFKDTSGFTHDKDNPLRWEERPDGKHDTERDFEEWATNAPIGSLSPRDNFTKMRTDSGDAVTVEVETTVGGHKCIHWNGEWLYYDPHAYADEMPWKPYHEIDAAELSFRRHPDDS